MNRIPEAFARARSENRAALIVYLCAGDPNLDATEALVLAARAGGADIVELGVPFSDPTADGGTIQRAAERALAAGTTLTKVLDVARRIRGKSDVPLLLFGYYNPILSYGEARLVADAAAAGVDGFLVVDLPPEAAPVLRGPAVEAGLEYVPLVAPTTPPARAERIGELATSFVYYVSMTGVTGAGGADLEAAARRAGDLQRRLEGPVAVGFGVRTADDVRRVAAHADGVVVGSALVELVASHSDPVAAAAALRARVSELRAGLARG